MDAAALLSWSLTLICSLSVLAWSVAAAWRWGSQSTPRPKRPASPASTPDSPSPSLARLESLAADQADLCSTLEKLTTTVKRLSSRQGMRDVREREAAADSNSGPPRGTSKADLLRHYGMSGKIGPAFAQAQLELETKQRTN